MALQYSEIASGTRRVPLYLLQFDRKGELENRASYAELFEGIRAGDYRDVYVFAPGWNNDFDASLQLFRRFFEGFLAARPPDPHWKPVFVGVQWPSMVIVFPWEKGPKPAGGSDDEDFQKRAIAEIASELDNHEAQRFIALAVRPTLSPQERQELARLTRAALAIGSMGDIGEQAPDEDELTESWRALQVSDRNDLDDEFGFADDAAASPQATGLEVLDPRNLIRAATVYMMKDRAGSIGSVGVRQLLEELSSLGTRVRLIGHSYGARVMLAALSTAPLPSKVRSALLLQPAVSQFCLAEAGQIPRTTRAGGFRPALEQLQLPLYATFSAKDFPLRETFHLALRRTKDLGEVEIAAGSAPSPYCALGGYGPRGLAAGAVATLQIEDTGHYEIPAGSKVAALDGTQGRINGHGDVTNRYTWWALIEQDQRQA